MTRGIISISTCNRVDTKVRRRSFRVFNTSFFYPVVFLKIIARIRSTVLILWYIIKKTFALIDKTFMLHTSSGWNNGFGIAFAQTIKNIKKNTFIMIIVILNVIILAWY